MAIRFDPAYNAEIRRVVKNFNQKRNRAIKRGFRNLPPPMKVSELKARYQKRRDLNRDLRLISKFGKEDALEQVETSGGIKAIKWEVDYLKANINKAKQFYDRQIWQLSSLDTELGVMKRELLNNLKAKRDYLDLELSTLTPKQYGTFKSTIEEYLSYGYDTLKGYRGWLNEVDSIMERLGYDRATRNKFFQGFDELTPAQFLTMYRQSNLISRIYELYIPTRDNEFRLSTTEEDAKNLIDTFIEEKDDMIKRAKQQTDMMNPAELDDFVKSVNQKQSSQPKLNRKNLTKEQIKMIEALGGSIEDLLK